MIELRLFFETHCGTGGWIRCAMYNLFITVQLMSYNLLTYL